MMDKAKRGVLLINLGTPDKADTASVRKYLKVFLDDPRVIDLPWLMRKVLLHLIILPFRPKKSAAAYAAIWDKEKGSPLLFNSRALVEKVQKVLGDSFVVECAMRYGNPSIPFALDKCLKAGCKEIIALPLFPQYSSAASGSAIENLLSNFSEKWNMVTLKVIDKFYEDKGYIEAQANVIKPYLAQKDNSHLVFSYHSLPVRQVQKSSQGCASTCFENKPCPKVVTQNYFCYRAQCYETSRLLANYLGLTQADYSVVFQSRLGRTVWIGPDIQNSLPQLIQEGKRNLIVACPSFVADCLETLEDWHACERTMAFFRWGRVYSSALFECARRLG